MLHNALLVTDVSVCGYIYSSDAGTWHVDMLTGDFEGGVVCMARGYIWTDEWHVTTSANGVSISRRVIESHRGEVVSPPSIMLLLLPCSTLSNSIAS
jgi:hypothetical protein